MGNNTININSMSKTYYNLMQCYAPEKQGESGFADKLAQKRIERASAVSAKDMTMEEYKQYIHNKISQIPLNPSQSQWQWSIQITEEGYEAMKNDPEYEAHVLKAIRANFSFTDHYHSVNYSVLHFGATEEESYGQCFGGGSPFMEKEEGFWDRRAKRREKLMEQYEEMMDQKAAAKEAGQLFFTYTPDLFDGMETE